MSLIHTLPQIALPYACKSRLFGGIDERIDFIDCENAYVISNVSQPSLFVVKPSATANGRAVIIVAGGGFHGLSIESEGLELAMHLSQQGFYAFVLKYRTVPTHADYPFQDFFDKYKAMGFSRLNAFIVDYISATKADGLNALKYVKTNAKQFDIDKHQVGIIGFSAGGAIALDTLKSRDFYPDFIATLYPYIDENDFPVLENFENLEKDVPLFVACAEDDGLCLYRISEKLAIHWALAEQRIEARFYKHGGHGFGMRKKGLESDNWIADFDNWLINIM